jgi:hypothetical protein
MLTLLMSAAACLTFAGCAANRPPGVNTPRGPETGYPIILTEDLARRQAALAAWQKVLHDQSISSVENPELVPVTSTIRTLPPQINGQLALPSIGKNNPATNEELRESLRRFMSTAGPLVCEDPAQLTLIDQGTNGDGTVYANYTQRPFRYRLGGDFGKVRVDFDRNRRLVNLTSSCLPDLDQTQRDIQTLRPDPTITPERIAELLKGRPLTGPNGTTATVNSPADFTIAEPLIVVRDTGGSPAALEFRLAWEIKLNAGFSVFIDAIDNTILPAQNAS